MSRRPNIIIFNPDQMRSDSLHHLGNGAAITPNLDSFAETDAVSFRNAFCQNPVCTPSRCSFLTGLYPHTYGQRTISHMLHDNQSSLLKELKEAGYYVWMNSRNDFLPAQQEGIFEKHADETFYDGESRHRAPGPVNSDMRGEKGSDTYYSFYFGELGTDESGRNQNRDDDSVDAAIDLIKKHDSDQPLCMFLGLMLPHPPYQIEEPYFSAVDRSKLPARIETPADWSLKPAILKGLHDNFNMSSWAEDRWDELRACYLGMCMKIDDQFGKLCDALKEAGMYDDTAIFVFSDHGDYTGDYGIVEKNQNTFEDCITNVPLLVKPPKGYDLDPGISESLVELVDFYATAVEFSGIIPDHTHFGNSLTKVLADRSVPNREYVFCEGGRMQNEMHCTEVPIGKQPSPENAYYPRLALQSSPGIEHGKATMLRTHKYKYVHRYYELDELYDLEKDPLELNNLAEDPDMQGTIIDFRLKMLNWYQATCDIVPLKPDSRFDARMLQNMLGLQLSEDKLSQLTKMMRDGFTISEIMAKFRK